LRRIVLILFVANEASNSVSLFNIDPASGRLSATAESLSIPKPVTIAFYARKQQG
jgi:6-phosphogluconolactonase